MKIGIIGNGKVGKSLHEVIQKKGIKSYTFARNPKGNGEKHINEIYNLQLEIIIIAVSDSAIETIAESLSQLTYKTVVVHVSGATPIDAIQAHVSNAGVLYPLQTFISNQNMDWSKIPIFVQASVDKDLEIIYGLANRLSEYVYLSTDEIRLSLHLSAVLTNNFFTHLGTLAYELLDKYGVEKDVLTPILERTLHNLTRNSSDIVQTGPAVRGDKITMQRHLKLINDRHLAHIYESISNSIAHHHAKK
ncbi:MAG TPA: DUF2520 domain-containing protein [Saprospiraceae bacterium]|mgnify:CR=1 FL=1|nr:DUF2520 domain-containing protein [Saprospiraceae bacterium]